jgi:phenylacetate-coenzyme A ligase PaaK-like adenylate-forming protein
MHPLLVRTIVYPLHERLKGKDTFRWLRRLEATQWWDPSRLAEAQLERLREHLAWAQAHVPYYQRLFDSHGIHPEAIRSLEDFRRVPFLTREHLRAHGPELAARARLRGVQRLATGGSTGAPVALLIDAERMGIGEGIRLRAHRWFGLEPGEREVVLWGSPIEVTRQDRVRALRDRLINSTLLSAFNMGEAQLAQYGRLIAEQAPAKMYGYASAFALLAGYLGARRWTPPRGLKAIFTTAEPLFDFQRKTIEEVFRCRVATEYGSRDAGLCANECPAGSLHVPAEGIVVEIDGAGTDGIGEIVVTNLYSPAMPIIRYRTGDLGRLDPTSCPCGRGLPRLASIEGRRTDFLVAADGRLLHALSIIYILRDTPGLSQFRVVQEAIEDVTVQVAPLQALSEEGRRRLAERVRGLLGASVRVTVDPVSEILPEASGKFRYVTSKVADRFVGDLLAGAANGGGPR